MKPFANSLSFKWLNTFASMIGSVFVFGTQRFTPPLLPAAKTPRQIFGTMAKKQLANKVKINTRQSESVSLSNFLLLSRKAGQIIKEMREKIANKQNCPSFNKIRKCDGRKRPGSHAGPCPHSRPSLPDSSGQCLRLFKRKCNFTVSLPLPNNPMAPCRRRPLMTMSNCLAPH